MNSRSPTNLVKSPSSRDFDKLADRMRDALSIIVSTRDIAEDTVNQSIISSRQGRGTATILLDTLKTMEDMGRDVVMDIEEIAEDLYNSGR